MRSGWACDKTVHTILLSQLPPGITAEVDRWRKASGIGIEINPRASQNFAILRSSHQDGKLKKSDRKQRDWGRSAERQEHGVPDMSHGDPLIRLLKVLSAYWKKRFRIKSPGLRKHGYKSLELLETEIASFKKGEYDPEQHGERVNGIQGFRDHAKNCDGSRDIGVQLFTALIRAVGIEARLVASLQPIGFGWSKGDEAEVKKQRKKKLEDSEREGEGFGSSSSDISSAIQVKGSDARLRDKAIYSKAPKKSRRGRHKGVKDAPIELTSNSDDDGDIGSVIGNTPSISQKEGNKLYDQEQSFPTYWTEAISPISNEIIPVDPFILYPAVATNQDHLDAFESKGAHASKLKQVFAYVIAYSPDGTAKDVTTRYLKRHMWPGSTKGVRLPIEKVPIYNRKGKIKHYEDLDWFKTVMSGYMRTDNMRTIVDDLEEAKDLKALKRDKKEAKVNTETLQSYKMSAEFVLERHLRREEAILPGSKPAKMFLAGKGDNAKEEPVYKRSQVAVCRTAESWHKEGRQIKPGEYPIKMVPVRAVTLARKREVEEAERDSGGKMKQGLYSRDQTDWIIPPPIENGVIPKNAYGNMDCFVDSMIPLGASHIPLKSTAKICKRLNVDFAEACVGFEFGMQRAVPIIIGVVVADEHKARVIDEWEKDEEERRIRAEGKREKTALTYWRKMLMGLRISKKMREDYGDDIDASTKEAINPFTNMKRKVLLHQSEKSPMPLTRNPSQEAEDPMYSLTAEDSDEIHNATNNCELVSDAEQRLSHSEESSFDNAGGFLIEEKDLVEPKKVVGNEIQVENNGNLHKMRKRPKKSQKDSKASRNIRSKSSPDEMSPIPQGPLPTRHEKSYPNNKGTYIKSPTLSLSETTPRSVSKRTAAKNSEKAVRSHYFIQDSDGGESINADSATDDREAAYQPETGRRRGSRKRKG